jgi:hypothetical protein
VSHGKQAAKKQSTKPQVVLRLHDHPKCLEIINTHAAVAMNLKKIHLVNSYACTLTSLSAEALHIVIKTLKAA